MLAQPLLKPLTKHHNFELVNLDTDSISVRKADHSEFSEEERQALLEELNSLMPELIHWDDDGYYKTVVVIKAKNYVLADQDGNVKIKGSALKATTKEKALQQFVKDIIQLLVDNRQDLVNETYMRYAREIVNLKDITQWCSKKTITKAILENERTNEKRVREALKGRAVQEGDKIYVFFKSATEISLRDDFDGTYDMKALLGKLYDTVCIFETVIPETVKALPNLALVRNKGIVEGMRE